MKLAELLQEYRWAKKITLRQLAGGIGISHSALHRLEKNLPVDQKNLAKVIKWIFS